MVNLAVTTTCNRSCVYCFGRNAPGESMSDGVFHRALDLAERSDMEDVRLLGGEPTLHPDFPRLVREALDRDLDLSLFSNGLMPEPALEAVLRHQVRVVVNVNEPKARGPGETERQEATLRRLGELALVGFNIHRAGAELDFLLDLIERFGLEPAIRLGLAHPVVGGDNRSLHPKQYPEVGRRIVAFAERAGRAGVSLELDCGFVPCMFPQGGRELGLSRSALGRRCNPILDVLPQGQVVACFPLAQVCQTRIHGHSTTLGLRRALEERLGLYRGLGIYRECSVCELHRNGACLGGCLAAAMQRLRPASQRVSGGTPFLEKRVTPRPPSPRWVIPYIDQPPDFWEALAADFGAHIKEIYFPLPPEVLGSGRPPQKADHLDAVLARSPFPCSVLVNPMTLPGPVEQVGPRVIEALRRLDGEVGLAGATVSSPGLAALIRREIPSLPLTASVLMDLVSPVQMVALEGLFDRIVPSSRIMRDVEALSALRAAFSGAIRLIVNEACLPGCPYRVQHFHEMGGGAVFPRSLCADLLDEHPWLRLTGAWVLPQHLSLFEGLCDEFKLAGRITLQDPERYRAVLEAYITREPTTPDAIGGGPAAVLQPLQIDEPFYARTLRCGRRCHECHLCREWYDTALARSGSGRGR